jgi:hypothetical protein
MDTALFYPAYLNLDEPEAEHLVGKLAAEVAKFGGVLTLNWHDRSIAPERLWDGFYCKLLGKLRENGAWFPTASQAVKWFRKRRAAAFETLNEQIVAIKAPSPSDAELPGLRLRRYCPKAPNLLRAPLAGVPGEYVDLNCARGLAASVAISA